MMAGMSGGKMQNETLVERGIQTEDSDYRLHVCFATGMAYFFPTAAGKRAIEAGLGRPFSATQPGTTVVTGQGRKVMPSQIEGCQEIVIPHNLVSRVAPRKDDTIREKGQKAIVVAKALLSNGLVPVPLRVQSLDATSEQFAGRDLCVTIRATIEVKCDWYGGINGLALQTHECNPHGIH